MEKVIELKKGETIQSEVIVDEISKSLESYFDFKFDGTTEFKKFIKPKEIPQEYNIGLIVGASGSGKSTLLEDFGTKKKIDWDCSKAIVSNFQNATEGINRLSAVGLGSVPTWAKPYNVLSNGEKFRANLSRQIEDGAVIDEFTSVVDRVVAKSTSNAVNKYIKDNDIKNVVFASCHKDIIEWLNPDWVIDTDKEIFYIRGSLRSRPPIRLQLRKTKYTSWRMFSRHHYLAENINKASKCYLILWDNTIVGFTSILPSPNGNIKNAYREHRTVILPDYQGLGIATTVVDKLGELLISKGYRYYSRTAHIKLGKHRDNSKKWIPSSKNRVKRRTIEQGANRWEIDTERICFSHEYVGERHDLEHFNIQINIENVEKLDYDNVKRILTEEIEANKDKFIVLLSGLVGVNTVVDTVAMELGLRREMNSPSRVKKTKINKVINL